MKRKELDAILKEAASFMGMLPEHMRSGDVAAEKARIAREREPKRMTFKEAKRWVRKNAYSAEYICLDGKRWGWIVWDNSRDAEEGRTLVAAVEAAMKSKEGR